MAYELLHQQRLGCLLAFRNYLWIRDYYLFEVVEAKQAEVDQPAHRRQHDRDEGNQTVLQQDGVALEKETMIPHYIFINGERY